LTTTKDGKEENPLLPFFLKLYPYFSCLAAGRYAFNGDARAIPKAFLIDASATKE
jgi:hypothetical protein